RAAAHALVTAHAAGSADKVVFEAMASARPTIVSSSVFAALLTTGGPRLTFAEGDAADLARRMVDLARTPTGERDALGTLLRSRVAAHHSLHHWADEIVRLATEVHGGRSAPAPTTGDSPAPAP